MADGRLKDKQSGRPVTPDAFEAQPVLTTAGHIGPLKMVVRLRVTDDLGAVATDAVAVRVVRAIHVDDDAPGANNGRSWRDAYRSLQSALRAAAPGDSIYVAKGTYRPTAGTDRTASFQLVNGVGVYGGFAGWDSADASVRDTDLFATVLSGEIGAAGAADNSYHVVTAGHGVIDTAVIDGFTISGGNAGASDSRGVGGGMYCDGGSPTIRNCTFTGNQAILGGGLSVVSAQPAVLSCRFIENRADDLGGGLYCSAGSPSLVDCTLSGNVAGGGAGAYYSQSSPTMTNCLFEMNAAGGSGGGMLGIGSSSVLSGCSFIGNSASDNGGGIGSDASSSPALTQCTFIRNSAISGGGLWSHSSSASLSNCLLNGNYASDNGGAMVTYFGDLTLINCTLSGNEAGYDGGGIWAYSASATMTACTVSGNQASYGAAIYNWSSSAAVTDCIIWGNQAPPGGPSIASLASTPTITFSDVQGGHVGEGNIDADPQFHRSPSPGADGVWGSEDDDYGDLRLSPKSPAIDAGNNGEIPAEVKTDLAGNPRFVDVQTTADTGVGVAPIVDMGAFEMMDVTILLAGTDGDDAYYLRLDDQGATLRVWTLASPVGEPACTYSIRDLEGCTFDGRGNDSVFLDLGGMELTVPLQIEAESVNLAAPAGSQVRLASLSVPGRLSIAPGHGLAMVVGVLAVDGIVDVSDNVLMVSDQAAPSGTSAAAGPIGLDGVQRMLTELVRAGRGMYPHWQSGKGITSSVAGGCADELAGVAVAPNRRRDGSLIEPGAPVGSVVVRCVFNGDVNVDGRVDGDDYYEMDAGFLSGGDEYVEGDVDLSGRIDGLDYFLADSVFLNQRPPALTDNSQTASTVVVDRQQANLGWLRSTDASPLE